jgi:hypothetical protein
MRRGAKAEETNFVSGLHARNAQAAKANNARAQQRSSPNRIESGRQREDEVRVGNHELCKASVHVVPGEGRRIAKILKIVSAVPALTVRPSQPAHANLGAQPKCSGCCTQNYSHDLMAGNEAGMRSRQFSFDDMEIGPANAACEHAQQHLSRSEFRAEHFLDSQRTIGDLARRTKHRRLHASSIIIRQ